jgi:hypothetical protein
MIGKSIRILESITTGRKVYSLWGPISSGGVSHATK